VLFARARLHITGLHNWSHAHKRLSVAVLRGAAVRVGCANSAAKGARQVVISSEYSGDEPLFYRNTGDAAITQRAMIGAHKAWLVRFEDNQVPKMACVAVRRRASGVIAANQVRCRRK
jgi:hypothetical protein